MADETASAPGMSPGITAPDGGETSPPQLPFQEHEPQLLVFTGSADEYFRIWAVNIMLTVATLGIYSAWAKVRREQFFARHTLLAGVPFDYHGAPVAILKGRVVAVTLFGAYTVAGWVSPVALLVAMGLIGLVLPWLLARSFRFRARNTSYRGLRFAFTGSVGRAYWVFLALPALSLLSLFALAPLWHRQMKDYLHDNAWYGQQRFTHHTPVPYFYATYAMAVLLVAVLLFAGTLVLTALMLAVAATSSGGPPGSSANPPTLLIVAMGGLYVVAILIVQSFMAVRIQNGVWAHTRLGEGRFACRLAFPRLLAIKFTNLIGIIVTLGLFRPVAQVRLARYMAEVFTVVPRRSLDDFEGVPADEVAAFGEEAAEIFDFDIAF
jgi:uncharacterized membrane protein YjgN (DUF898 family)